MSWFIAWLGKAALTKVTNDVLSRCFDKGLLDTCFQRAEEWRSQLPQEATLLSIESFFTVQSVHGPENSPPGPMHVVASIESGQVPTANMWLDDLFEHWFWVRENIEEPTEFFRLDEDVANVHLSKLANMLSDECMKDPSLFQQDTYKTLRSLHDDVKDIRDTLPEQVDRAVKDVKNEKHGPPLMYILPQPAGTCVAGSVGIADLAYHREWLEYQHNRKAEAQLSEFLEDPKPCLWWGMVGSGGTGKSRLAHKLVKDLRATGMWECGFLLSPNQQASNSWIESKSREWRPKKSFLLVIDYSSRYVKSVVNLLSNLADPEWQENLGPDVRVRVLLLDRPGKDIAPLSMDQPLDIIGHIRTRDTLRSFLYQPTMYRPAKVEHVQRSMNRVPIVCNEELLQLGGLPRVEWRNILAVVLRQTGNEQHILPDNINSEFWDRVDRLTDCGRMLFLQILGICLSRKPSLTSVLSESQQSVETLLDDMMRYERDYRWPGLFEEDVTSTDMKIRCVEHAVGFVTLARGVELPKDSETVLKCANSGAEELTNSCTGGVLEKILPVILHLTDLPGSDTEQESEISRDGRLWLEPLQPDLLGERLLLSLLNPKYSTDRLLGFTKPTGQVDPTIWVNQARMINPTGLMATIQLLVEDFPHAPETKTWLQATLLLLAEECQKRNDEPDFPDIELINLIHDLSRTIRFMVESTDALDVQLQNSFFELAANSALWSCILLGYITDAEDCSDVVRSIGQRLFEANKEGKITSNVNVLARMCYQGVAWFGSEGNWDKMENWGEGLPKLIELFPGDENYQELYAAAAARAMSYYATAGRLIDSKRWGDVLKQQAIRFSDNSYIQLVFATGAANMMIHTSESAEGFSELESWGDLLKEQAKRFPDNVEIQRLFAAGAVSAIAGYLSEDRWQELETWCEVLRQLARSFPDDTDVQDSFIKGTVNAIPSYSSNCDWERVRAIGNEFMTLAIRFPDNDEIQMSIALGVLQAVFTCGSAKRWEVLGTWGSVLAKQTECFRDRAMLQVHFTGDRFNMEFDYSNIMKRHASNTLHDRPRNQEIQSFDDAEIRFMLFDGAVNLLMTSSSSTTLRTELAGWMKYIDPNMSVYS